MVGLISMRSVKTLRTIEGELIRSANLPERWHNARPIVGEDDVTAGWNQLLAEIESIKSENAQRAPAALDQQAITMARAMRGLPVAWVITDLDGRIQFLSVPACSLLSLSDSADHTGRNLLEFLNLQGDDADALPARQRLLGNLKLVRQRHELISNGNTLHLRIARSRLDGRSGDGDGLAWIIEDATQQELATKARDQFLMTATHELRTPLSNLQAYAEALQEEDKLEIERQKEFCNVIVSEANRLGRLVDQLLTVGQMEAGSMVANRHELEVLPLAEYAADQMMAQAQQKHQQLVTDFSPKLPTVFGDREKLQAALVNLVATL